MSAFDSINIGAVIARERKRCSMTQGDVANFVGVSKAAVSKWELGISLPDITLLPKLSALFSISIEELLGYEAMLPEKTVQEIRDKLLEEFKADSAEAYEHLDIIVRLHYSSWSLLLTAAALLLAVNNGTAGAIKHEDAMRFTGRGVEYCERVERDCPIEALVRKARKLHVMFLLLSLGDGGEGLDEIVALLGPNAETDSSSAPLLAEAYYISGDFESARHLFQLMLTDGVELILASVPFMLRLVPSEDDAAISDCALLATQLYDHFGRSVIDPLIVLGIFFSVACISLSRKDLDGATRAFAAYAVAVNDLDAVESDPSDTAPLHAFAKARRNETLEDLVEGGNTLRYVEEALRILHAHAEAMSSRTWLCLAETKEYKGALGGAQRAIARFNEYKRLSEQERDSQRWKTI